MGNFVIYVVESRGTRERLFKPWPKEAFATKGDALDRCDELREKFAHVSREFRVKDYWDQRPW